LCCGQAGSEQLKKSGAEGDRKTETISINRSLTNLGMCIGKLANRERHVPFRDSKLTHYLQPYLGGEAKTLMFGTRAPTCLPSRRACLPTAVSRPPAIGHHPIASAYHHHHHHHHLGGAFV
jgi:hypothetical protein